MLRGFVHKLKKAECNKGHCHKLLNVNGAQVLFNTTGRSHGSTVRKFHGQIEMSSLNSCEFGAKFTRHSNSQPHVSTQMNLLSMQISTNMVHTNGHHSAREWHDASHCSGPHWSWLPVAWLHVT